MFSTINTENNIRNYNSNKLPTQVQLPAEASFKVLDVESIKTNGEIYLLNLEVQTGPNSNPNITIDSTTGKLRQGVGGLTYVDSVNDDPYASNVSHLGYNNYIGKHGENYVVSFGDSVLDQSFTVGNDIDNYLKAIEVLSNNTIVIGGLFNNYGATASNYIAFLNDDGTLNKSFAVGFNNYVRVIKIQIIDGVEKLLVGGDFSSFNGNACGNICRLNSDGSFDNSFNLDILGNPASGFNGSVYTIDFQSDGKIIIGGNFTSFNGNVSRRIIRLFPNGSFDSSFAIGTGFNSRVQYLKVNSNNKIIAGGQFGTFNGINSNYIARLNSDGTYDVTFSIGSGFNSSVIAIAINNSGTQYIVGGQFGDYNGNNCDYICRLNLDGTFDSSFQTNVGQGFDNYVNSILIDSNDRIILGGWFNYFNNNLITNYMCRLNQDGTLDRTFDSYGLDDMVYILKFDKLGRLLVGGNFTQYYSMNMNYLARFGYGNVAGWELIPKTITASYYLGFDLDINGNSTNFVKIINIGNEDEYYFNFNTFPDISNGNLFMYSTNNLVSNLIAHPTISNYAGIVPCPANNPFFNSGVIYFPPALWNINSQVIPIQISYRIGN